MVLYKHSNRPNHDCIYYFNLRRAQNANMVFHQSSTDAIILFENMPASVLDKVVTFAGEVLYERKSTTSIKPEAAPGERIDLRISSQPEVPHTEDEKAENAFRIFQLDEKSLRLSKHFEADCRFAQ